MKHDPMPDRLMLSGAFSIALLGGLCLSGFSPVNAQIGGDLGVGRGGDLQMDRSQGGATGLITDRPRVPAQPPVAVPTPSAGPSPAELADEISESSSRASTRNPQNGGNRNANRGNRNPNQTGAGNNPPNQRDRDQRDRDQRDRDQRDRDQRDRDQRDRDPRDRDQRDRDLRNRDPRDRDPWNRGDWREGGYSGRYDDRPPRSNLWDRRFGDNRWNDGRYTGSFGQRYNGRYYTNPTVGRLVRQFPGATRILAPNRYDVNGVFFRYRGTYYYHPNAANATAVPIYGVSSGSIPNGGRQNLVEIDFGGFEHMQELTQILPIVINDLCLDMYYNYPHNSRFMPVYRNAWQVLQISKDVQEAADVGDREAVREQLLQADRLLHAVDRQTDNWTRREQRQIGEMGIITKLQMVADLMHHTMYDAGIRLGSHATIQN